MIIAQRRLVALHRTYTRRLVDAHEEERAHVAREVHDDAIQRLVVVRHELDQLEIGDDLGDTRRHRLDGVRNEVQDLADSLRKLAHRLHPATIDQAGLCVALAQLADEIGRTSSLRVNVELPETAPALSRDTSLALFRIAQESLRNAARHSGAREAALSLRENDDAIELEISDDGAGFDPARRVGSGIGLVGIEERARLAGGTARVASAPGRGTRIIVRLPHTQGTE